MEETYILIYEVTMPGGEPRVIAERHAKSLGQRKVKKMNDEDTDTHQVLCYCSARVIVDAVSSLIYG